MPGGSFSTREVLQLTGATARQLQWWDEHRLVVPGREGRRRLYSSSDLADILVVLELKQRHISLHQVRRVLRFLKKQLGVRLADLVAENAEHFLPDYHLLIDGNRLYLETDTQQVFDLLRNTEQAVFLVSLRKTVKRLRVRGNELTKEMSDLEAAAAVEEPPAAVRKPARVAGRRKEPTAESCA